MQLGEKIILLFFLLPFYTIAQSNPELITNGSFEEIDTCQVFTGQPGQDVFVINGCKGWNNPLGQSTSDHYCYSSFYPNSPPSITGLGFQYPRTGQCMAGLVQTGNWILPNYREYIQNELKELLKANQYYDVEFYVSLGMLPCAYANLGIKSYTAQLNISNAYSLVNEIPDASISETYYLSDTLSWNKVKLTFKAQGGEKYFIIGNFSDSISLHYKDCDSINIFMWDTAGYVAGNASYLFIDDVSLRESEIRIEIPNVFTPNDDNLNDAYEVRIENIDEWKMNIYNRWGLKLETLSPINKKWIPEEYSNGIYFYVFEEPLGKFNQQGSILLIK